VCVWGGFGTYMCFKFLCVPWSGPYLRALMRWRVVSCVKWYVSVVVGVFLGTLTVTNTMCIVFEGE